MAKEVTLNKNRNTQEKLRYWDGKKRKAVQAVGCRGTSDNHVDAPRRKWTASHGSISEAGSHSTISRELARNSDGKFGYIASQVGTQVSRLSAKPRKALKLMMGSALFEIVVSILRKMGRLSTLQAHCNACTQMIRNNASVMSRLTTHLRYAAR